MNTVLEDRPSGSLEGALDALIADFEADTSLPYPPEAQIAAHIAGLLQICQGKIVQAGQLAWDPATQQQLAAIQYP